MQQETATLNRFHPKKATVTPTMNAAIPDMGLFVANVIAGKVITASVT